MNFIIKSTKSGKNPFGTYGIYADMMFTHFNFCWNKAILSVDRVWKLLPAVFSKFGYKFFLSNVMRDHMYGKPGNILILFACLLFRLGRFGLKVIRFSCFKIADSFCFIKENNFSLYFHEADLIVVIHLFR